MVLSPQLAGIVVGILSAVLFASRSGADGFVAAALFFLTPLPILLAGMGWGRGAGLLGLCVATALVGLMMAPVGAIVFLIYIGLPAIILAQLVLLHREASPSAETAARHSFVSPPPIIEWYPAGRIVAWASVIAGAVVALGIGLLGDAAKYRELVKALFDASTEAALRNMIGPEFNQLTMEWVIDITAHFVVPSMVALFWLLLLLANVWLAVRTAAISGQLERPSGSIASLEYPPVLLLALICAAGASMLPGQGGVMAMAFVGAFACAYMLLGLAVIHSWAALSPFKPLILVTFYLCLTMTSMFAPIHILILALVGLGEQIFQLRKRISQHPIPPGPAGH